MSLRSILAALGALALSGCASYFAAVDAALDSADVPPQMGMRMFPNEGVFLDQPRFMEFPADPVFAPAGANIRRPDPGEQTSPMMRLRGIYQTQDGNGRFHDCNTDRAYPIAGPMSENRDIEEPRTEARAALESAYAAAQKGPDAPVQVSIDARLVVQKRRSGAGFEQAVLVEKFDRVLPGTHCSVRS